MIKALTAANKSERDRFTIPRSVQQSIPIKRVYEDGIWLVGRKHSRTWRFTDVNYAAASEDDQRGIFLSYGGVLNSLPTDAAAKVTKRIQYNRYADDFVVGVIGSKQDALSIKEDLRQFLSEKLKLTLSEEKTKVTHSSEAVRYLGYDIRVVRNKAAKRTKNGALRRVWYGQAFLYVPHEKWENKLHELRAMQVKWDKNHGRNFWRPMHRNELVNSTDVEIVSQYNSEIRGLYNFYRIAENVGVLNKFYYKLPRQEPQRAAQASVAV